MAVVVPEKEPTVRLYSTIGLITLAISALAWPLVGCVVAFGVIAGLLYLAVAAMLHKHRLLDDDRG